MPAAGHGFSEELLRRLLPPLVLWAASGLSPQRRPDFQGRERGQQRAGGGGRAASAAGGLTGEGGREAIVGGGEKVEAEAGALAGQVDLSPVVWAWIAGSDLGSKAAS